MQDVKHNASVVVVTGLAFEARIARGPGVRLLCQQNTGLAATLDAIVTSSQSCQGLVSFGTAGALVDSLRPGALLVARTVVAVGTAMRDRGTVANPDTVTNLDAATNSEATAGPDVMAATAGECYATDERWSQALLDRLTGAIRADLAGIATPVSRAADKQRLQQACGAWAVDMESHIVARIAYEHGLPFVGVRAIADPAERSLPPAALAALSNDGSTDLGAVLRSLLGHPGQLPALLRVARDAYAARRTLVAARRNLPSAFGLP